MLRVPGVRGNFRERWGRFKRAGRVIGIVHSMNPVVRRPDLRLQTEDGLRYLGGVQIGGYVALPPVLAQQRQSIERVLRSYRLQNFR